MTAANGPVRAVQWSDGGLRLLDQTALPGRTTYRQVTTVDAVVDAIVTLAVRGAPALGAVGAYGVAVAMLQAEADDWDVSRRDAEIDRIRLARPTAVNLAWGVDEVRGAIPEGVDAVLALAHRLVAEDEAANRELSRLGADWIEAHLAEVRPETTRRALRAVTHCNTGALATTGWGTAYGIIHELHDRGRLELVYADETRPLLQGSRLTSWELTRDGIPHVLQCDGSGASTILRGLVDVALIGADRITANGDVANKVGSVALALACRRAGIPFVVAAPFSTVDLATATGGDIVIEERSGAEVTSYGGVATAPEGALGFNPAFDVTPSDLVSAIATERGVVEPATAGDSDLLARLC